MTDIMDTAARSRAELLAPGAPFELCDGEVHGRPARLYRNAAASLAELIDQGRRHGESVFIVYEGEQWTFNRFFREVDALAAHFHAWGVGPGDRVAIAMRNRPEWAVAFAAAAMRGAVPAPVNSFGLGEELAAALAVVAPRILVCDAERLARLEPDAVGKGGGRVVVVGDADARTDGVQPYRPLVGTAPEVPPRPSPRPDDPALILFTSGASSRAKAVLSSHRAVCQAVANIDFIGAISARTSPEAVAAIMARGNAPTTLTAVPLFHVSGLHAQLLSALRNGRRLVFMHRWDPARAITLIQEHRVTQFNGAPAMVMQLLAEPGFDRNGSTASLAGLGFGGAGLPQRLIAEVHDRMPDSMCGIGFGLTETNGVGAAASGRLYFEKPRSAGLLSPIVDVRIVDAEGRDAPQGDQGEIWLRGVTVMDGYWNDPAATAAAFEDGWFRTGDVGFVDGDGLLFVVDRIKDVINRSGEKIAAAEVESALLEIPEVLEVAVFAVADEATGEAVAAAIVVEEGRTITAEDVRRHVAAHLAGYKVPAHVYIRAGSLPRNPAGKVLKSVLRGEIASERAAAP